MSSRRLGAAMRFDGAWWRRFAELGCVYGPEWWKRGSPPVIAALIYLIARENRERVLRNQAAVRGPRPRWREHRDAYAVFREFARSLTEALEQWGPRPRPVEIATKNHEIFETAIAEGRGLVVLTGHFGSWEVGARYVSRLGRPVNMVTASDPNPSVREMLHEMRTRYGFRVIYSDRSVLTGLPILQALRRHEVVGLQIEPWGPLPGSWPVDFFGRRTAFQLGPFEIARVARAPIVPVFAVRTGIRRYELRIEGRFDPRTRADSAAALEAVVRRYEDLVRAYPSQWLMFEDVWPRTPPPDAVASPLDADGDDRRSAAGARRGR